MKFTITTRQRAQVRKAHAALLVRVKKAGLTIKRGRVPWGSAHYDAEALTIVLRKGRREPSPFPWCIELLVTIAHEYGHHLSRMNHVKVGRLLNYHSATDTLFEEKRAWNNAAIELRSVGIKDRDLWSAFTLIAGSALATNVEDFESQWWLVEKLKREKIQCPCGSRALDVLGLQSSRDCSIVCRRCNKHTTLHSSVEALARGLRRKRFTGLCRCKTPQPRAVVQKDFEP